MANERQNEPKRTELGTQIKIIISISFNVSATDKLSFSTFVALATRRISNILRGKYKKKQVNAGSKKKDLLKIEHFIYKHLLRNIFRVLYVRANI